MKSVGRKKGFTLAELAVVMTVSLILMSSIVTLIGAITRESARNDRSMRASLEVDFVRDFTDGWFTTYASPDYTLALGADGKSVVATPKNGGDGGELKVVGDKLSINGNVVTQLEYVSSVNFTKTDGVFKVEVFYLGERKMIFLFVEGGNYA